MTKVTIWAEEYWPVYEIVDHEEGYGEMDLDDEIIDRYENAMAEFYIIQALLRDLVEAQEK